MDGFVARTPRRVVPSPVRPEHEYEYEYEYE